MKTLRNILLLLILISQPAKASHRNMCLDLNALFNGYTSVVTYLNIPVWLDDSDSQEYQRQHQAFKNDIRNARPLNDNNNNAPHYQPQRFALEHNALIPVQIGSKIYWCKPDTYESLKISLAVLKWDLESIKEGNPDYSKLLKKCKKDEEKRKSLSEDLEFLELIRSKKSGDGVIKRLIKFDWEFNECPYATHTVNLQRKYDFHAYYNILNTSAPEAFRTVLNVFQGQLKEQSQQCKENMHHFSDTKGGNLFHFYNMILLCLKEEACSVTKPFEFPKFLAPTLRVLPGFLDAIQLGTDLPLPVDMAGEPVTYEAETVYILEGPQDPNDFKSNY